MQKNTRSLLDALAEYQGNINDGWFTVASTLDRITGYNTCEIAKRFRETTFEVDDPDWIVWRAGVYIRSRFWQNHLVGTEQLLANSRGFPGLEHYVEAAKPSVAAQNGFDAIRYVEEFLRGCRWTHINCLLPEPCYESWTNDHSKDPKHLADSIQRCCTPTELFGASERQGRLKAATKNIGKMLMGAEIVSPSSCRLRQYGGDGSLDAWIQKSKYLTDLQFAEAKRLAIENPPPVSVWRKNDDVVVSDLIPRFRDHVDTMFDRASLKRIVHIKQDVKRVVAMDATIASDSEFVATKGDELAEKLNDDEVAAKLRNFTSLIRTVDTDETWPAWVQLRRCLIEFARNQRRDFSLGDWISEDELVRSDSGTSEESGIENAGLNSSARETAASQKSPLEWIHAIVSVVWGDPKSRVPKYLMMIGASGIFSTWWLPFLYAFATQHASIASIPLDAAETTAFWGGLVFFTLGLGLWISLNWEGLSKPSFITRFGRPPTVEEEPESINAVASRESHRIAWSRIRDEFFEVRRDCHTLPAIRWHPKGDDQNPPPPSPHTSALLCPNPLNAVNGPWIPAGELFGFGGTVDAIRRLNLIGAKAITLLTRTSTTFGVDTPNGTYVPAGCAGLRWVQFLFELATRRDILGCRAPRKVWEGALSQSLADLSDVQREGDGLIILRDKDGQQVVRFDCNRWYQEFDCILDASISAIDFIQQHQDER